MNINQIDLNLLIYLDILLREQNVTRAASYLNVTQPAMSNALRRLRALFDDPLLVRTRDGMQPTERALALAPSVHQIVAQAQQVVAPEAQFDALHSQRVFRISASDYAESALLPAVLSRLRSDAPNICLDVLTPSDVEFADVERGKVDLVINRFDTLPKSFNSHTLWADSFSCLFSRLNPLRHNFTLPAYLQAKHVWVSKTGMGVGVGVNPSAVQQLGWVDEALRQLGHQRQISVFTRHYQTAMRLAEQHDLVVTLPSRTTRLQAQNDRIVIKAPPFPIEDIELKMAWSPLVEHSAAHRWLRRTIVQAASSVISDKGER
ncbi:MAG: LysR substrate-binding domain-containing protein [Pseudomonadota bacterium]